MRIAAMAFASALGFVAAAVSANAAAVLPEPAHRQDANVVQAAWYCGLGHHLNRWGRCVRNRYAQYQPRSYGAGSYYRWHAPNDFVANQLNRQQLVRPWGY